MKVSEYCFYFDESFHDRKITNKSSKGLNINAKDNSDIFIGAFTGFKTNNINKFEEDYKKFEVKYKEKFTLDEEKELKAVEVIKKKNFQLGFNKLNANSTEFYNDYFDILINNQCIFQMNFFSKIEFLVTSVIRHVDFNEWTGYVNQKAFLYSLIKFIHNYKNLGIAKKLINNNNLTNKEIVKLLKKALKIIEKKIENIKRKELELKSIRDVQFLLNKIDIYLIECEEVLWDYSRIFEGFQLLLDNMKVHPGQVEVLLDRDERVLAAGKKSNQYFKIDSYDSDKVIGIRSADILSNFFGRLIYSVQKGLEESNIEIKTERKLLSCQWFKLNEAQFSLVKKIELLFESQMYYSTYSSLYSDYTIAVFSYINYINGYKTYDEYEAEKNHWEKGNNYIIVCLGDYINNFQETY